jgi:hypothetical protein
MLDVLLMPIIPVLADLFFYFLSLMVGSFVLIGRGFGKIRTSGKFKGFWTLFIYTLLEAIAFVTLQGPITGIIELFLRTQARYISGLTAGMFGTFFVWFVRALDFRITRDYRWIFPVVCYGIAASDLWFYPCIDMGFMCLDISFIWTLVFLISIGFTALRTMKTSGEPWRQTRF